MLMKIIKLYFLMALALLSGGCKGWLTIDSSDRIMENTLFETEEGFFTALNGVYAELPQASLYGKSLAAVTFDVQAQYFDTTQPSTHTFNTLGAYSAEARKTAVADTWDKAYFVIANVNKILEHCESDRDVLSDRAYHIIRGEMLGMRALLHFEMLRIFGPVFAEAPARVSIPYRTSSELTVTPLLPANEVAEKIAGDFTDALSELADWDPVRTEGRLNGETTGSVRYRSRHLRLNYFAVKALQARLAIYTGDRTLAGRLAGEVIDEAGPFFPFASREDVTGQTAVGVATQNSEDRIFSSEALFSAVNSKRTSDIHDKFFSNKLEQVNLLTMGELAVHNLYDSESDLRTYQWQTLKNTEGQIRAGAGHGPGLCLDGLRRPNGGDVPDCRRVRGLQGDGLRVAQRAALGPQGDLAARDGNAEQRSHGGVHPRIRRRGAALLVLQASAQDLDPESVQQQRRLFGVRPGELPLRAAREGTGAP